MSKDINKTNLKKEKSDRYDHAFELVDLTEIKRNKESNNLTLQNEAQNKYDYLNHGLPNKLRVDDLISRMSIEEKVAQMTCVWLEKANTLVDESGKFDPLKAKVSFPDGLGQVGRLSDTAGGISPKQMAELANDIQKFFKDNTRLSIPAIMHEECLHGHAAVDGTSFPQPIGLASTFDPDLVKRLFAMTAEEARSRGAHQALSPVLDVAREPRWGRVEETFGEDPYLVSLLGIAAVQGLQGDSLADKKHLIATLKHFVAHGQPESGTNCAPVNVSTRILREIFLYPFKKVIQEARAISVMASYNEVDGVPSHANRWLLKDILRDEWGFEGYVVSDYYAIRELNERPEFFGQFLAKDGIEAAALAAKAGINIELPDMDCYPNLVQLVRDGIVPEELVDDLVRPMLEWKFNLGLFDDPYVDPDLAHELVGSDDNRMLALEAAHKTITLLKNDTDILPLNKSNLKKIAIIGPNADRVLLGGYSGKPKHESTVLSGIRDYLGTDVELLYHEGCKITVGGSWQEDTVTLSDPADDRISIAQAVEIARQADVVILAIGGNEQTSREAWDPNHKGDRIDLQMVGLQDELVDAIAAVGKPIVALLFNGRPLAVHNLVEKVPAILECWYLGQETGRAVADVIFGEVTPGGKLPITIPRSVGHIPAYYNYKPSARRSYLFDDVCPLFAFGFGLSYTQFEFSTPNLHKQVIKPDESTCVSVDIKNSGKFTGDEVVQMYIRDCYSSVTRPVKELKGFQRITIQPGETKTVTLDITPEHLAFYDINMDYLVEPGEFEIMIGSSSQDSDLHKIILTVQ